MTETLPLDAMALATRVLFFDIEASGLHEASVPVELGWAWITREAGDGPALRVKTEAMLIRPLRAWMEDPKTWDPAAERIHGISRRELVDSGRPAGEVALAFDQARAGKSIVSDTGHDGVDARWLRKLCQAARKPRYPAVARVDPSHFWWPVQESGLGPDGFEAVRQIAPQASHRAAEDAARPAWILAVMATLADMASNGGKAAQVAALGRLPRDLVDLLGDRLPKAPNDWDYRPIPGI